MEVPVSAPSPSSQPTLARCRARARMLLAHLRGSEPERARNAALRFQRLQSFAHASVDELCANDRVRLKHALTVVALEAGQPSWVALKAACMRAEAATAGALPADAMYAARMSLWLNRWFADYDEARASLDADGGYLLPYRHHFFVTTAEAIRELGLDPFDDDWRRIGFDWVRPADPQAHARLLAKRRTALA